MPLYFKTEWDGRTAPENLIAATCAQGAGNHPGVPFRACFIEVARTRQDADLLAGESALDRWYYRVDQALNILDPCGPRGTEGIATLLARNVLDATAMQMMLDVRAFCLRDGSPMALARDFCDWMAGEADMMVQRNALPGLIRDPHGFFNYFDGLACGDAIHVHPRRFLEIARVVDIDPAGTINRLIARAREQEARAATGVGAIAAHDPFRSFMDADIEQTKRLEQIDQRARHAGTASSEGPEMLAAAKAVVHLEGVRQWHAVALGAEEGGVARAGRPEVINQALKQAASGAVRSSVDALMRDCLIRERRYSGSAGRLAHEGRERINALRMAQAGVMPAHGHKAMNDALMPEKRPSRGRKAPAGQAEKTGKGARAGA